jgi:hypothetical protein
VPLIICMVLKGCGTIVSLHQATGIMGPRLRGDDGRGFGISNRSVSVDTVLFSPRHAPELGVDCHPLKEEGAGKAGCATSSVRERCRPRQRFPV